MTQLCECSNRECRASFDSSIEQLMEIRKDPRCVIISKECAAGPDPTDVLVDEGANFYVYVETIESTD